MNRIWTDQESILKWIWATWFEFGWFTFWDETYQWCVWEKFPDTRGTCIMVVLRW